MHFGVGGLHRAHQAVFTEDAMNESNDPNWGITGVGIMPHDKKMAEVTKEQDNLYSLIIKPTAGSPRVRIINAHTDYILGCDNQKT